MHSTEGYLFLFVGGLLGLGILVQYIIIPLLTMRTVLVTITGKDMVVRNKQSVCMVYTEDEIFENTNSFFPPKFCSLELQHKLQINGTYKLHVCGLRIQISSWFRNILSAELIEAHHWSFLPPEPDATSRRATRR